MLSINKMDVKALKDLRAKIFNDLHSKKTILDKRTFASLDKAFKSLPILKEFKGNQNPNNAKNLSKLKSHHTKLLKVSDLVNQHNSVVNTKKKIKELEKKEPLLNDIKNGTSGQLTFAIASDFLVRFCPCTIISPPSKNLP